MEPKMEAYLRGLKLYGEQKHAQAIEAYKEALAIDPDWTDAIAGLAMAQMHAGLLDEAIVNGKRIVELDPEDPFGHTNLSMFYQRKGMIEEAEQEGAKARMLSWKQELKTNPNAPPPGPAGSMPVQQ